MKIKIIAGLLGVSLLAAVVLANAVTITLPATTATGPNGAISVRLTGFAPPSTWGKPGNGVLTMPPSTQFSINAGALIKQLLGFNVQRIQASSSSYAKDSDWGAFRIICNVSHMLFDDPIVYPGQPGKSHLHTFFGNSDVNGMTDVANGNLANFGRSTCHGGTANRSAYWVPALIDTSTGFPIKPTLANLYYKAPFYNTFSSGRSKDITVPVPGLRMIAGDPKNTSNDQSAVHYRWDCYTPGNTGTPNSYGEIPTLTQCPVGSEVLMLVFFPQCWDGVHLDSPNHQSHMAYQDPYRGCPGTHPVTIPVIQYNIHYLVTATSNINNWRLASDTYSTGQSAGRSAHGDWINGWDQTVLGKVVNNCLRPANDCHDDLLGDGTALY